MAGQATRQVEAPVQQHPVPVVLVAAVPEAVLARQEQKIKDLMVVMVPLVVEAEGVPVLRVLTPQARLVGAVEAVLLPLLQVQQ